MLRSLVLYSMIQIKTPPLRPAFPNTALPLFDNRSLWNMCFSRISILHIRNRPIYINKLISTYFPSFFSLGILDASCTSISSIPFPKLINRNTVRILPRHALLQLFLLLHVLLSKENDHPYPPAKCYFQPVYSSYLPLILRRGTHISLFIF